MMATKKKSPYDGKAGAEFAKALRDMPDRWVMCRDMRHAWEVANDFHVADVYQERGRKTMHVARILQCTRCETLREEMYIVTKLGLEKISQYYTYPAGYMLQGIPRGVKPQSIIQQEQYRRALESAARAERGQRDAPER